MVTELRKWREGVKEISYWPQELNPKKEVIFLPKIKTD